MEALGNILDNAIKYTNTGGITIKLCSYELFACVEVTDTGIGIGEEEHAAVFGRFTGKRGCRKERCGDRTVSGTFYHAAAGADISGFRPCLGQAQRLGCIFQRQLCQNCKNLFFSPGQILERILCDNLKEGRKCQIRSKRRLQDGHFGNQRFEKTVWHGGDRRARAGG